MCRSIQREEKKESFEESDAECADDTKLDEPYQLGDNSDPSQPSPINSPNQPPVVLLKRSTPPPPSAKGHSRIGKAFLEDRAFEKWRGTRHIKNRSSFHHQSRPPLTSPRPGVHKISVLNICIERSTT